MSERETPPGPASVSPAEPPVYEEGLRVPADPVVSPADTIRLAFVRPVEGEDGTYEWDAETDEELLAAPAALAALLAVGERDRRQIARLTEALKRIAAKDCGDLEATIFDGSDGCASCLARAVLADEEDAPDA